MPRYSPRTGQLTEYQVGPYDTAHIYVQWGGKLPGLEQWSCGFRMFGPGASAAADATAMLPGIAAALHAFHIRATSKISSLAKFSYVKCNGVGTDGKYLEEGTNQAIYADIPGGGVGSALPNQIALAVTWETGFSRGPAHSGRIYLPSPAVALVESENRISAADAVTIGTSVDTLRTAVNQVNAAWELAVFSRKAGAPGHRAVTGCRIGRVLDTQRRRRRSVVENYQ
jgi:hypothetical protein